MNIIEAFEKANGKEIVIENFLGGIIHSVNTNNYTIKIRKDLFLSKNWKIKKEEMVIWVVTYRTVGSHYSSCTFKNRHEMEEWKENNKGRVHIVGTEKYIDEI